MVEERRSKCEYVKKDLDRALIEGRREAMVLEMNAMPEIGKAGADAFVLSIPLQRTSCACGASMSRKLGVGGRRLCKEGQESGRRPGDDWKVLCASLELDIARKAEGFG